VNTVKFASVSAKVIDTRRPVTGGGASLCHGDGAARLSLRGTCGRPGVGGAFVRPTDGRLDPASNLLHPGEVSA